MATLPQQDTTVSRIYKQYEDNQVGHRPHLGASEIGHKCSRYLWLNFRHAFSNHFDGRILRLFKRGEKEEQTFISELKNIGAEVSATDENGKQHNFEQSDNKHFKGSMDFAVRGLVESPKTWHVGEVKTASDKRFKAFQKDGVEKTEYKYYAQVIVYMAWTGMKRAIIFISNKNNDEIYAERIRYCGETVKRLIERARQIVFSFLPPDKISQRPDWFECKICPAYKLCHQNEIAQVNCRTCCHSEPKTDGTWQCSKYEKEISNEEQAQGCDSHLFIPQLVPAKKELEVEDISGKTIQIKYKKQDGVFFINGKDGYSSREIAANFNIIGDAGVEEIRSELNAEVVG